MKVSRYQWVMPSQNRSIQVFRVSLGKSLIV